MAAHKPLPSNPDLRTYRNRARTLANDQASKDDSVAVSVSDARNLVAREYGFDDWDALRTEIEPASTHTARNKAYSDRVRARSRVLQGRRRSRP